MTERAMVRRITPEETARLLREAATPTAVRAADGHARRRGRLTGVRGRDAAP